MKSHIITSALTIALGLVTPMVGAIVFPDRGFAQMVEEKKKEADRLLQQGIQQAKISQYVAALQFWQQALLLYREIKDRQGEGNALRNLGLAYHALGNYPKAINYLEQHLAIAREIKDRGGEGAALGALGIAYDSLSNYPKAIDYHEQSLAIAREIKDRRVEGSALGNLGIAYRALGNYPKAISYHEQRLEIAREIKDRQGEGNALGNLGNTYYSLGNYPKAIDYHEQRLVIAREIKDRRGEGNALANLGLVYRALGNYPKAINYYEQHLAIAHAVKDRQGEGTTLGNLGNAYHSLGNYSKAIDYHEQHLAIAREIKDRQGEGNALGNLGLTYDTLGDYSKAIEYLEQVLAIAREIKDRDGEGTALGNLGLAYQSLRNYPKTIDYHEQSLAIAREIKDRRGEGVALANLGLVYQSLRNYPKAIDYQEQSLAIDREIKNRSGESTVLGNLGVAYYSLGNYPKAIDYHEQHLIIAREIKDREGEYRALNNLGSTLKQQNQTDLAISFYKQSVNVAESIRANLRKLPREAQERYTSTVSKTYRNLADLLLTQGRTREAQAILELLKVQESQIYDEQQQKPSIQFPLHPLEAQIWQQIENKKSFTLATLEPLGKTLKQNRYRITQDMNRMAIAIGNPSTLLNAKFNTLLIQNLVVGDKLWVIWTNAKGEVKTIALDVKQQQLIETVDRLRRALGNPNSNLNDLKATSQQLYNWLIPPALQTELAQNPKTQLLFSLDHVTRYIPIAALYDGQQYLIQKHTLSNLITTDTDMGDRLTPNGQLPNILALGTSKALAGFSALPNVEAELNAIVRTKNNPRGIYPGTLHLNEAFTANSLRTAAPHRILHIATHGSFNPKTITASFLLLGNGDKLPITDIATLTNLNDKHLVVLSACETGISSSTADGTEISGISNYFLRRGAKSVLASLWNVNDASTALMMQQFYKNLATGTMTKSEAIRQVQRDFIAGKLTPKDADALRSDILVQSTNPSRRTGPQNLNLAHPYYWAPFILIGNGL